jgi:hypothetical protein
MLPRLLAACVSLWILGILGQWIARAVIGLDPVEPVCRASVVAFLLGGSGYAGLSLAWLAGQRLRRGEP